MQESPHVLRDWTEYIPEIGYPTIRQDAPAEVVDAALSFEREFYGKTGRRRYINLDLNTGHLLDVSEAVERHKRFEADKIARLRAEYNKNKTA